MYMCVQANVYQFLFAKMLFDLFILNKQRKCIGRFQYDTMKIYCSLKHLKTFICSNGGDMHGSIILLQNLNMDFATEFPKKIVYCMILMLCV